MLYFKFYKIFVFFEYYLIFYSETKPQVAVLSSGPLLESLVSEINKLEKVKENIRFTLIDIIKKIIDLFQSYEAIKAQIDYDFPLFRDVIFE